MNEGWAYIKIGSTASGKQRHYYEEGSFKGKCGHVVEFDDRSKMVFIDKSEIMSTKICPKCEIILCGCNCHNIGYRQNSIGICDVCPEKHTLIKYVS